MLAAALKELFFFLEYLQKTNVAREEIGRRATLHGDEHSFALALECLDSRILRSPTLRKKIRSLILHYPASAFLL